MNGEYTAPTDIDEPTYAIDLAGTDTGRVMVGIDLKTMETTVSLRVTTMSLEDMLGTAFELFSIFHPDEVVNVIHDHGEQWKGDVVKVLAEKYNINLVESSLRQKTWSGAVEKAIKQTIEE